MWSLPEQLDHSRMRGRGGAGRECCVCRVFDLVFPPEVGRERRARGIAIHPTNLLVAQRRGRRRVSRAQVRDARHAPSLDRRRAPRPPPGPTPIKNVSFQHSFVHVSNYACEGGTETSRTGCFLPGQNSHWSSVRTRKWLCLCLAGPPLQLVVPCKRHIELPSSVNCLA